MQDHVDIKEAAKVAVEKAEEVQEDEGKCQAFALIVPTRKALNEGAPSDGAEIEAEKQRWYEAIAGLSGEVKSLLNEGVLEVRPISEIRENDELIPALLILTVKSPDPVTGISRRKARIVACGNFQRYETHQDIYSPVVGRETWWPLIVLMLVRRFSMFQIDVRTAFLQTDEKDDDPNRPRTYMRMPWGTSGRPGMPCNKLVWLIRKSIYGLKTAACAWRSTLVKFLRSRRMRESKYDPSVFVLDNECIFLLYIDDLIVLGRRASCLRELVALKKRFKCTEEIELSQDQHLLFLGHSIQIDGKKLKISQQEYIQVIADRFEITATASGGACLKSELFSREFLESGELLNANEQRWLRSAIGSVGYLTTRPDLSAANCIVAEGQSQGRTTHIKAMQHLLQFMIDSNDRCLEYVLPQLGTPQPEWPVSLSLVGYFDASYGVVCRSGMVVYLDGFAVFTKSKKQVTIALSSCESELVSCTSCCKELLGLRNLLADGFGIGVEAISMSLCGDNSAANMIAQNQSAVRRVRHIQIDHLFVRSLTNDGTMQVHWVKTNNNPSDMLTKVLGHQKLALIWLEFLRTRSGGAHMVDE